MGLGALALVTAPEPPRRAWLWAGLLTGVAALWRLDFGLYAAGAVGLTLLLRGDQAWSARIALAARYAAVAFLTGLAGYLPFVLTVGPADLYAALVGDSAREREYWTLPFPLAYDGSARIWPPWSLLKDAKDVLGFYVPLLVTVGMVVAGAGWLLSLRDAPGRARAWLAGGALVFGLGGLLYLFSRADEFHASPGIVALALALPLCGAALWRRGRPGPCSGGGRDGGPGPADRVRRGQPALRHVRPPAAQALDLDVAPGITARPVDARALPPVIAEIKRRVPPGDPIYVTTRRSDVVSFSNPLVYVLADRPNILDRDVALFARPGAQRHIVRRLRSRRPRAVVRWTDPVSARREDNLRGDPSPSRAVDRYLARAYRPVLQRGYYTVLAPRRAATR